VLPFIAIDRGNFMVRSQQTGTTPIDPLKP